MWSELVLDGLSWLCKICDGSALSESVLSDLWWFCMICDGNVWFELDLGDLSRFCKIYDGSALSEPVLRDLWWFCMIWVGCAWSVMFLCDMSRFCMIRADSVWFVMILFYLSSFCVIWVGFAWSEFALCLAKVHYSYVKFDEKQDGDVAEPVRPTIFELHLNFVQKWTQGFQKLCHLNFEKDSNWATTKTPRTTLSSNSNEFDKLIQKKLSILPNLDISKIFARVLYPFIKLDEKYDGDVAEPVRQPFSKYAQIWSKNGAQGLQKWCHLNFDDGF